MPLTSSRSGQTIPYPGQKRRRLLALGSGTLSSALVSPFAALAQQPKKVWRIGFLAIGVRPASIEAHALGGFSRGMRELGYIEGRDFQIDWRFTEGKREVFFSAAAKLAQTKVDFIIAATGTGVEAARKATSSIPIIMVNMGDPVGAGFVASLARPSGNITGLSNQTGETISKHPEFLRIAMPGLSSVAVWINPPSPAALLYLKQIQTSAATLGMKVRLFEVGNAADIESAIDTQKRERINALIITPDPFFSAQSRKIAELALAGRIATMFWTRQHVEAGGLMSYGQDNAQHYHRAAYYVDKIIKGAKPAELPVEQGTSIELVLNLKTAKAIGLTMPKELLFRAQTVIE